MAVANVASANSALARLALANVALAHFALAPLAIANLVFANLVLTILFLVHVVSGLWVWGTCNGRPGEPCAPAQPREPWAQARLGNQGGRRSGPCTLTRRVRTVGKNNNVGIEEEARATKA